MTSAWSPRPIVVDGRGDDWAGVDSQGVADDALYVAVANDDGHVALHADPEQPITVGLELTLPEPGKDRAPERGRGGGSRGGASGGAPGGGGRVGGGRGGAAGGGRFGGGGESPAGAEGGRRDRWAQPTEVWLKVKLAVAPAPTPPP